LHGSHAAQYADTALTKARPSAVIVGFTAFGADLLRAIGSFGDTIETFDAADIFSTDLATWFVGSGLFLWSHAVLFIALFATS
jgi:hypothetical protein